MRPVRVILGAQWGDEGKGKIVDILAPEADVVVRFQGGANAGHTVLRGDKQVVLHLLPTGVLHDVRCLLGSGMVIDPWALAAELDAVTEHGVDPLQNVRISAAAHLVMPYHRRLDELREESLSHKSIGTTHRGIGPAYEDKMARRGMRIGDLLREDSDLRRRVIDLVLRSNEILAERHDAPALASEAIADEMVAHAQRLRPMIVSAFEYLAPVREGRWSALLEGAQGTLLDIDHGTYPFVTSSNCTIGGALTGSGLPPQRIDEVLGVYKAYTTRVGNGPFPSELFAEEAELIRDVGSEFGATTGRPRRCGWFDAVAAHYAAQINGINSMAVTKLDVLTGLDPIRVCVGYEIEGERLTTYPVRTNMLERCKPVYQELPGWTEDIAGETSFDALPAQVKSYLEVLEKLVGVPVQFISTGPQPEAWIDRAQPRPKAKAAP